MTEPVFSGGVRHGELLDPGQPRARRRGRGRVPRRAGQGRRRPFRLTLWLPLTPLWLLLAPFALLLAPALSLLPPLLPDRPGARAIRRAVALRPYPTAFALGALLLAMSGTYVTVDTADAQIRLRIF
jgi:hypothetical protein